MQAKQAVHIATKMRTWTQDLAKLVNDDLAEWSKAVALGAIPKGREFEPHSHQNVLLFFSETS